MPATLLRSGSRLLPFLVLVAIHLLSGLQMEQPTILADELGYLGNARYLAGTAHLPDMRETQFVHFGYSLFLLPAFWLFAEPVSSYKTAITINALLASCLYFPLHFILISFLDVPRSPARWIAFSCCLYPSLILYSSFAWSENAFITFYAVATALFGKYLASTSARDALLFGLLAGFRLNIRSRRAALRPPRWLSLHDPSTGASGAPDHSDLASRLGGPEDRSGWPCRSERVGDRIGLHAHPGHQRASQG
jgi:hypothetical protein